MNSGVRALVSAVMLAGFLAIAALQLGTVVVPVLLLLAMLPGSVAAQVGVPVCTATVGVLAYATWRALHQRRSEPAGVPVSRADAPELWALLDDAAGAVGTRVPDTVTVVAEAVGTLRERSRLLGILGGRRDLYLGLPVLQAWNVAHLRAIVAHELAHGSDRLGRWAPLAYRGRVAVGRTVPRISRRNPAGPVLRAYARLYRRVDAPFSRAQELAADQAAAAFAGPGTAAAVLLDLPVLDAGQRLFYAEYVGPGWQAGYVPDDIFGGFLRVLAARADELAALRSRERPAPGPWDTHPPLAQRLAALSGPNGPASGSVTGTDPTGTTMTGGDSGPTEGNDELDRADPPAAGDLVPDLPGLGRALQAVIFPAHGRTTVGWDEFFGAARTLEIQREADAALATLSRAAGTPVTHAGEVLDLAADGRLLKATEAVFPQLPADATAERATELVKLLLALAALRSGAARWRHSWTGTAELVAIDGSSLDLGALAVLAGDPGTVDEVRRRLAALDVDPAVAGQVGSVRTADRAGVVGGLVNLVVDGARADVVIVDTGLFLLPGLPRSQNGSAKRRLARFAAAGDSEREAAVPGSRFIPYEDVAGAAQTRRTPRTWDLRLRDGTTLTLRAALDSGELPGGWAAFDDAIAFLARTRAHNPGAEG